MQGFRSFSDALFWIVISIALGLIVATAITKLA